MGMGLIAWGFFLLHFHILNTEIFDVRLIPFTVSLPMIILGLLYSYRATRKNIFILLE